MAIGGHPITVERVRKLNSATPRPNARYVLYWAQMNRRVDSNHALLFAAELASQWQLPLLYYEGLDCAYPHASDRFHTFVLEGVPETARRLSRHGIGYNFYLRRSEKDANDIVYRLAASAAAVVTDDYPAFVTRKYNATVPARIGIPYYAVDSSCIVPMARIEKREYAAYTIRPKIRKLLPDFLRPVPPLPRLRPFVEAASPHHTVVTEGNVAELAASCAIDHSVKPPPSVRGGRLAAEAQLRQFLDHRLVRYARERNEPSAHATSNLSPYLHFGQLSSLEVALLTREYSDKRRIISDEFLEELIVRRELAFNYSQRSGEPASLTDLPSWALETLRAHDADSREFVYTRDQFERGETHDRLWNAAQKEMLLRGRIHGYYRMYWGKKIIEWSPTHREAFETMVYLHDRYALDGRDPNTYANILWCFGLHDRPWSTRPVFGMVRYMSFEGMKRKTDIESYIREIHVLERTGQDSFRVQ